MSRLRTMQRRARRRRRYLQGALALDGGHEGGVTFVDPWGRPCGLGTWSYWLERGGHERFIVNTHLPNGRWVSTVWVGLSASFIGDRTLGFETGIFGPGGYMDTWARYMTREDARIGHAEAVAEYRAKEGT